MSEQDKQPDKKPDKPIDPPDGRGPRPTDPNELAKWIVEQTAEDTNQDSSQCQQSSSE